VAEYIEFQSADTTMRDRFGVVPSIPFDEGLRRLAAFFNQHAPAPSGALGANHR
jgi:hypothetical protein